MGLDIVAYRNLAPAPDVTIDDDGEPSDVDAVVIHQPTLDFSEGHWPGRAEGIAAGAYRASEDYDFRAGSYGGYNNWRRQLADLAGWQSVEAVWDNKPKGPFVELIDFADNEGVIGPVVSAKLAKDFADFQAKADGHPDDWFRTKYADWRQAFEMAADNGAVDFR